MELKEFIETTLNDICDGVEASKNHQFNKRGNGPIAPGVLNGISQQELNKIKFELVVEVSGENKKGVGGKIKIYSASIGADISKESTVKNVNKITFEVPFAAQALSPEIVDKKNE